MGVVEAVKPVGVSHQVIVGEIKAEGEEGALAVVVASALHVRVPDTDHSTKDEIEVDLLRSERHVLIDELFDRQVCIVHLTVFRQVGVERSDQEWLLFFYLSVVWIFIDLLESDVIHIGDFKSCNRTEAVKRCKCCKRTHLNFI